MVDVPDFDELTLAKLAREMVVNVKNVHTLFEEYGIDEEIYYELYAKNDFFKRLKDQYTKEWNSTLTTKERVQAGSLAYLEQLLPKIAGRALFDPKEPLAAITSAGTLLAKAAGIGDNKVTANTAERFVITINLGGETETYNKSIDLNPNDIDLGKLSNLDSSPLTSEDQEFIDAFEPEIANGQANSQTTPKHALELVRPPREG